MSTTTQASQVYRVYIRATAEAVWDAITEPEWTQLQAAAMPEVVVEGDVIEEDPPRKLVRTWQAGGEAVERVTRLTYQIEEGGVGVTSLTVTHELEGAPGAAAMVSGELESESEAAGSGWNQVLNDLKNLLENGKYRESPQWEYINNNQVTREASANLAGFKSEKVNYKLALWDPQVNGVRYLKTLIYGLAAGLAEDNWSRLRRIHRRDIGDPITVKYNGESICLDYLQAVCELEFITENLDLDGLDILEIGAGYGRTCHAMMSNHSVASYCIVDLDNTLQLSRRYLREVLEADQYGKIRFVTVNNVDNLLGSARFDLCINIDSMAEMTAQTVQSYLALIAGRCRYFYVKNPVGKYLDKSLDGHSRGPDVVALALSSGLLRDVIDIHDNQAVEAQRPNYIRAYRPGDQWACVADGWAIPWSYYWQALYQRNTPPARGPAGAGGQDESY